MEREAKHNIQRVVLLMASSTTSTANEIPKDSPAKHCDEKLTAMQCHGQWINAMLRNYDLFHGISSQQIMHTIKVLKDPYL